MLSGIVKMAREEEDEREKDEERGYLTRIRGRGGVREN